MHVNGSDCSIMLKTQYREMGIPYSEETIREAYSLLKEEAAIEGGGVCGGIRKNCGVTGCVVTPLGIATAPLLLYFAFGCASLPVFVSETRGVFRCNLRLLPVEDCGRFTLVQDRGGERRQYGGCAVTAFELRFNRGQSVKLKLDIAGTCPADVYPYTELPQCQTSEMSGTAIGSERFHGDCVSYCINGTECKNIYGVTVSSKRAGGTNTELWIKRSLQALIDLPSVIEELTITAQLLRDRYEYRSVGVFRITLKRLVLVSDETTVDCTDSVIGPLRYYVTGPVSADVFSTGEERME